MLVPKVSIRYRPTAASPFTSPARTERTYARTRSSMSETDRSERSRMSRSVTGYSVDPDAAEDNKSTEWLEFQFTTAFQTGEIY